MWPFQFVICPVCGRFRLWPYRLWPFWNALVCGHCRLWQFRFWSFRSVVVMTCFLCEHLLLVVCRISYWFCVQEHSLCKMKQRPKYLGLLFALLIYLYWQHTTGSMQSFNVLPMLWYPSWKWLKNKIGFSTWSTSAHYENMTRFIFCSSLVDYIGSDSPYNWHGYLMVILLLSNCWSR